MKAFLQGAWIKHPLHPILVSLPVGLWPAALALDLVGYFGCGEAALAIAARYAIGLGIAAALLAVPTGLADWWDVKPEKPAWKIGVYHLALNALVTALWAANFAVRYTDPHPAGPVSTTALTLSVVGTVLLAVSVYLGGQMVYDYGVGVARHSKKKWRKIAKRAGAKLPDET